MIKLEVEVRDTDYDSLIDRFLPLILDQLRHSDSQVARLISAGMPESMIKSVLKKLPLSAKDQLVAELINNNKDRLSKLLMDTTRQNGIPVNIGDIKAKTVG